jgi:hypothetical protein
MYDEQTPEAQPAGSADGTSTATSSKSASPAKPAVEVHRKFDIPDHIVANLGPCPALTRGGEERFYSLLRSFADEHPPLSISDWCDLWDRAVERYDIRRASRAIAVLTPLYRGRAKAEIARPEARRFLPEPRYVDRSERKEPEEIDETLGRIDPDAVKAALSEAKLDEGAIDHLAYVMSLEKAAPLEALRQVKLNRSRDLEQSLVRRKQLRAAGAAPPVQDAEFEPASEGGGATPLQDERTEEAP